MARSLRVFQVDAFAAVPFAGNPAGVVLDAEGLDEPTMQHIARELGQGDAAFVLPPRDDGHDLYVRFFSPRAEAAFVGHATLAVHAVLESLGLPPQPRQAQKSGLVMVDRLPGDGEVPRYAFSQPPPPLRGPLPAALLANVLAALGIGPEDLDPRLPPEVSGGASTRALLALRDPARLAALRPDLARLADLAQAGFPPGCFAYVVLGDGDPLATEARMFCPALGIPEDPVSGNAHAMLAHRLCAAGLLDARQPHVRFTGRQGAAVGRPGEVSVELDCVAGAPQRVRIGGQATIVWKARLRLPR